jgi:uncharacterized membrane protein
MGTEGTIEIVIKKEDRAMAATIAGTFETPAAAQRAVERLQAAGVPAADISMIVRDREAVGVDTDAGTRGGAAVSPSVIPSLAEEESVATERAVADEVEPEVVEDYTATAEGTAFGGLIGALGGLLVGLGTLALPGLGAIVAAGPLAAALGGAAIGAATGGLIGALVDAGVPREYATTYASHVERGHVLLTVRTESVPPARAREIMVHAGAVNVYPTATTPV